MQKGKLTFMAIALMCGSLAGGIALDGLALSAPIASGVGAGVAAAVMWSTRRLWNRA